VNTECGKTGHISNPDGEIKKCYRCGSDGFGELWFMDGNSPYYYIGDANLSYDEQVNPVEHCKCPTLINGHHEGCYLFRVL
jgi:hypothetical protein